MTFATHVRLSASVLWLMLSAMGVSTAEGADKSSASRFDPQQTFAPYAYPQPANAFRSASGMPGALFWQNRADYVIQAALDPVSRKLSGSEVVT